MKNLNNNSTTENQHNPVERVREQLELFRRSHPEFKLPPPPRFVNQFEGWFREAVRRGNLRSERMTAYEQTELARQYGALYDQIIALAEKEYSASRLPCRAAINDVMLLREASQAQLGFERSQRQRRSEAIQDQLELRRTLRREEREREEHKLAVAKIRSEILMTRQTTELEWIRLDKQVDQELFPRITEKSSRPNRHTAAQKVRNRVEHIVRLRQKREEMKARHPADVHPIIDREFQKEIDRLREERQ